MSGRDGSRSYTMSETSPQPSPAVAEIAQVLPGAGSLLGSLTFPAYRHLLDLAPTRRHLDDTTQPTIQPIAIAAWVAGMPVGLILAEAPLEGGAVRVDPELLSLFVLPQWRSRGIAGQLVAAMEFAARERGFGQLAAVWMTGKPSIPAIEHILEKRGWKAPETRTISVRFTPEEAARTPWFQRVRLSEGRFQIVPWSDVTVAERDEIRRSHEAAPWIARGLEPWRHDSYGFDPISSLGLRYGGSIVGWVINHRMSHECVRFTCSFMRQDLSRRGRILPLYTESILRLSAAGIKECTLVTPLEYSEMAQFLRRRCASAVHFFGETRGSVKLLTV
jgi:GNAT superfamily N-acetyltransferase